jgi:hypothetical protein
MLMMMFENKLEDLANHERDATQKIMPKKNVQKMNNKLLRMIKKGQVKQKLYIFKALF